MDFEKVFGKALRYPLSLRGFVLLLAVNFVFSYFGVSLAALASPLDASSLVGFVLGAVPYLVASTIVNVFLMAMFVDNASKYFSGGRKPLAGSVLVAKSRFLRLLGVQILTVSLLFAALLPMLAFILAASFLRVTATGIIGMFAGFLALVLVAFFVFLAPYIAVLDKHGVFGCIKSSVLIVMRNKLNMFLFMVVYFVILMGVGILSLPVFLVSPSLEAAYLLWQSAVAAYTTLFGYSAFTNFYLSAKRK